MTRSPRATGGQGRMNVSWSVAMPEPGVVVEWSAHLRADVPEYVAAQVREVAHRQRCTVVAVLLRALAAQRDGAGRKVFSIRPEDLVADRRRIPRS